MVGLAPGGVELELHSREAPEVVGRRINAAVLEKSTRTTVRAGTPRRRLIGSVEGNLVRLSAADDNIWTRPKSWTAEFVGEITTAAAGSRLLGTTDLPDRRQLDVLIWGLRAAGIVAALFAIVSGAGEGLDPGTVVFGFVIIGLMWLATEYIRRDYVQRAAQDADWIEYRLRAIVESEVGTPIT